MNKQTNKQTTNKQINKGKTKTEVVLYYTRPKREKKVEDTTSRRTNKQKHTFTPALAQQFICGFACAQFACILLSCIPFVRLLPTQHCSSPCRSSKLRIATSSLYISLPFLLSSLSLFFFPPPLSFACLHTHFPPSFIYARHRFLFLLRSRFRSCFFFFFALHRR
ncbi:hypothetical protein TbgDal_X9660 [Trypanosoma brucei gambiense DAL972]|uniref:Uncharacterized protein n=1 Tax=Trypanosoma brucei gambiense (strain MHOM/CI/86/DAL972) TaxID=679716 RepID=D0A3N1_TRYB9|nr:hypothetical protein TbgDal_X9660 [Trypanosoma brucei gambiense DAL972]CBH15875.1 hypothetical protein TbgDal_X9660 [Trypanosoma brucei gambiense DAL972]|eukprot:XP_011778139.1 hypothetical protein TbgDal_X9660 [Trypanosoma brucei gambiense DAL972]